MCTSSAGTPSRSRGSIRPSFAFVSEPSRLEGRREGRAPAGTRSPVCGKTRTGGPQVAPEQPGLPCADGFHGFLRALPGERCTIAPVALRMADVRARSGEPHHRKTWRTGSGRQDHTTSPSAHVLGSGPDDWRALAVEVVRRRCQRRVAPRRPLLTEHPFRDSRPAADLARRRRRGHRRPARVS